MIVIGIISLIVMISILISVIIEKARWEIQADKIMHNVKISCPYLLLGEHYTKEEINEWLHYRGE